MEPTDNSREEPSAVRPGRKQELVTILAILVIVVVVVAAVAVAHKKNGLGLADSSGVTANTGSAKTTASGSHSAKAAKDGSYTATIAYDSPGGTEKLTVQVTLKNGLITDTSATSGAVDPEGQEYQDQFINSYKQLVVGKPVDSVQLSRVSGSSLTSQGFNDALQQIRQQAEA